ncbi:MAG: hypothetical protein D6722_12780 [Bacteroidetes bacterium]|nr:MAG: hypothetical protein D6722_12780 [Bacteroidota bacterium]
MSQSGLLASWYQEHMNALGLTGEASAVPVPERHFDYREGVIASSDSAVLQTAERWLDLGRWVVDWLVDDGRFVDFRQLR